MYRSTGLLIILTTIVLFCGCDDNTGKEEAGNDTCIYDCPDNSAFILVSSNSGLSWKETCSFENIASMVIDISVIDSNNIWLCTAYPAKIVYISDSGRNWDTQYHDSTKTIFFNYIEMFDELCGIAMGDGNNDVPLILRTEDGGQTWTEQLSAAIGGASADIWRRIDFLDLNIGYFRNCCNSPQLLYKTVDGGVNWTATNYVGGVQVFKFYDENIGFVIAGENQINRTLDGGLTWNTFSTTHTGWGFDIEFSESNPANIWLLANGVFFSSDTGKTWNMQGDSNSGRNIVITGEEGWVLRAPNLYYSQNAVVGNWELIPFEVPINGSIDEAIDAKNRSIVIPGLIND